MRKLSVMKRSKLNAKERGMLRELGVEQSVLRYDWPRRLRNALRCLVDVDPRWITWVESVTDPKSMTVKEMATVIEVRARRFVLEGYRHSLFGSLDELSKRDWPFGDDGNLIAS